MITWLLALALAAPDTQDLLDEARRRAVVGDFEGSRIVADQVLGDAPGNIEARYLVALALELEGRPGDALPIYDALLDEITDAERLDDVRFRRAEALGRAGRYLSALEQLDQLGSSAARSPSDVVKLELLRGLWELELPGRRSEEQGLERIHRTLESAAPVDASYHQGIARARLAELALNQAATIEFHGRKRKKAKRLEERARLVTWASDQIVPMLKLDATEATLETFLRVGQAFEAYGEAMLHESRVRGLNADQRLLYETERQSRVEALWVKASRYYDRGIQFAEIADWQGPESEALREALSDVVERVDGLATDPTSSS